MHCYLEKNQFVSWEILITFFIEYKTSLQASKDVANFYASWDLMEICTLSNIVALAEEISLKSRLPPSSPLSKCQFEDLVLNIYKEIEMFSKWRKPGQTFSYARVKHKCASSPKLLIYLGHLDSKSFPIWALSTSIHVYNKSGLFQYLFWFTLLSFSLPPSFCNITSKIFTRVGANILIFQSKSLLIDFPDTSFTCHPHS